MAYLKEADHMLANMALIITSISAPNRTLSIYAQACRERNINFIVIGDMSSPPNFSLEGCDFWSMLRQADLPFRLAKLIPERHYARKNLGYMIAIHSDVEIIIETDDDNLPLESFWTKRKLIQNGNLLTETGWVNVYSYFTDGFIWPRGFPLELVKQEHLPLSVFPESEVICPIQQGLANENPDIDAIFRLTAKLPFSFEKRARIILGKNSWCPFNSQNTTWFKQAFPLLYLPSYCSFRMTDIWRSFVAQRICWANDWSLLFHDPTVWQERNEHDLMKDFEEEIPGYLNNRKLCAILQDLDIYPGKKSLPDSMITCYRSLVGLGFIGEQELQLLNAWLEVVVP